MLALGYSSLAANSHAQEPVSEEHSTIEPSIGIELRYDDNIYSSATQKESSLITLLSPGLLAIFVPSKHRFELEYNGNYSTYEQSSADNSEDHELLASAFLELGLRSQLDIFGSYEDGHENRGSGLSDGLNPDFDPVLEQPDEYTQRRLNGRLTYGVTGTRGRLVFEAGERALRYKNNRERTEFFNYDNTHASATFYFRIMPSTSLLVDVRANEFDYQVDRALQPRLDSTEYRYLLGVTWDVTDKTTGTVKFGYVEKQYADTARARFSDTSWEVYVRWSPLKYSHFDFMTSRYPSEVTSLTGDVIENTTYSVAWSHDWTTSVRTRLGTYYVDQDFRGTASTRLQTFSAHSLTAAYKMRRWLTWEFGINVNAQDSNIDRFGFDGTVVRLGAIFTF
ncbi:MAG: outer membrane beta-barrel protein [Woeseia sp.]